MLDPKRDGNDLPDLCLQPERELTDANEKINALVKVGDKLYLVCEHQIWRKEWRKAKALP